LDELLIFENDILGSLDKLLFLEHQPLSEKEKTDLVQGIAAGMLHLHNHNIIHRDLAARNIFLTSEGEPKISVLLCFFFISFDSFQFFFFVYYSVILLKMLKRD
jgi:serine/threonine protein kinase